MSRTRSRLVQAAATALRALFQAPRQRPRLPGHCRAYPRLESLEERTAPAVFSPTSFVDDVTPDTLRGAIRAALWVHGKSPGLYDMQDVLGLK